MTYPAIQKFTSGGMLLNQTIIFVSLNQTLSAYFDKIINQAIAKGYTCVGSSDGIVTAALDGVNRWSAIAAVRSTTTTAAHSWVLLRAANGAETLFDYVGAGAAPTGDDIARICCSPGNLYALAGTATFSPIASDELVGVSGTSLIGATASGNRVANVIVDSAHNGFRAWCFRAQILAANPIYCELFNPSNVASPTSISVPVWVGSTTPANMASLSGCGGPYVANGAGGQCRAVVSGTPTTLQLGGAYRTLAGVTNESGAQVANGNAFINRPIGVSCAQAGQNGDIGERYDWNFQSELQACGQTDASKLWIMLNTAAAAGAAAGTLWPWDGVTVPVTT